MQKVFVVDTDSQFIELVQSLCPQGEAEVAVYSSSMEIFSLLAEEKPVLIFLSLEIDDLNEFVMHDLLKKTNVNLEIPLYVTYTDQSEESLKGYEKLKYRAEGYFKKPISQEQLQPLIQKHTSPEQTAEPETEPPANVEQEEFPVDDKIQEDSAFDLHTADEHIETIPGIDEVPVDDEFSDEQIEKLVRGGMIGDQNKDDKESTNPFGEGMADTKQNVKGSHASNLDVQEPDEDFGFEKQLEESFKNDSTIDSSDDLEEKDSTATRTVKELKNQLVALERQNEFLRTDNKELTDKVAQLENDIRNSQDEKENLLHQLQQIRESTGQVQGQLEGVNREMAANLELAIKEKEELATRLQEAVQSKDDLSTQLNELKQEKEDADTQRQQTQEKLETAEAEKSQIEALLDELKEQMNRLEEDKTSLRQQVEQLDQQLQTHQTEKEELSQQVQDLTNRLTDKEREVVALNHEFEKDLQVKSDELVQQTEQRLQIEFKNKEEHLLQQLTQIQETSSQTETQLKEQLETLTKTNTQLETEKEELTRREESLNRTVSTLAEEKVTLSEKVTALEEQLGTRNQEIEQKESVHREAVDQLANQLEESRQKAMGYKEKMQALSEMFQQAISLTQEDQQE